MSITYGSITWGTIDFQSDKIFTESIQYRSMPERVIGLANVSRKLGVKYLSSQFTTKKIVLQGHIIADDKDDLVEVIDDIQRVVGIAEQNLVIETGRTIKATLSSLTIPEQQYTQSTTAFTAEFIATDPYSTGVYQNASFTLPSGTLTDSRIVSISGSVYAEPTIALKGLSSGADDSGITAVTLRNAQEGHEVTISGIFPKSYTTEFAYQFEQVTLSGVLHDYIGEFGAWPARQTGLTTTLSGSNDYGTSVELSYSPRYFL